MKKISKLVINPEKLMTDRELVMLRGGYGSYMCWANKTEYDFCDKTVLVTPINTSSCENAWYICLEIYGGKCVTDGDCSLN